ncbi:tripartite tricarboxylate transporter substrate binding protein [Acetobacteraceae bacterium H6797]|nr:tripartite tricarboxylate transporter substrate binding protein [Acetobacteraceae bacterium H6797]
MGFPKQGLGRRGFIALGAGLGASLGLTAGGAMAQSFPSQPIKLVVPFSPGGAVDIVGRLVGQGMGSRLGQSVVVENRTGASGAIGAQTVARSPADGYTLMMAPLTSFAMLAGLPGNNLNVNFETDFAPVGIIGAVPIVVVVNGKLGVNSLAELIALARSKPGELNYASSGNGSTEHLAAELFSMQTGAKMMHVPYRGGAPAMADLMAGQVDLMFATLPNAMQNGAGLRILAIATRERSPAAPSVPTSAEAGLPDFEVSSIYGLLAPTNTSAVVVGKLEAAMMAAVESPDIGQRLMQQGIMVKPVSAKQTGDIMREELHRWAKVIATGKITL